MASDCESADLSPLILFHRYIVSLSTSDSSLLGK